MVAHNRRLQYTVRVTDTNPGLANLAAQRASLPKPSMSHGQPPLLGPWNQGTGLQLVEHAPLTGDGGDANASVRLDAAQQTVLEAMSQRLMSDPSTDPETGAEPGMEASPVPSDKA